jgi:hypothetical protein
MPAYTVCGLVSPDTGHWLITAVYGGQLAEADLEDAIDTYGYMERWSEGVIAESPEHAKQLVQETRRYGAPVSTLPASLAERDSLLVYDDGDAAHIVGVRRTGDHVHLTLYDSLTNETCVTCYDASTQLCLVRPPSVPRYTGFTHADRARYQRRGPSGRLRRVVRATTALAKRPRWRPRPWQVPGR